MDVENEDWESASEASIDDQDGAGMAVAGRSSDFGPARAIAPGVLPPRIISGSLPAVHSQIPIGEVNTPSPTPGSLPAVALDYAAAASNIDDSNPNDGAFLDLGNSGGIGGREQVDTSANTENFLADVLPRQRRPNPRFEKYKQQLLQTCRRDLARSSVLARLSAAQALHRAHVTMHIASLAQRSSAACDPTVQSVLLSMMPGRLLSSTFRHQVPGATATVSTPAPMCIQLEHVGTVLRWFRSKFEPINRGSGPAAPPPQHVADADWLLGLAMQPLSPASGGTGAGLRARAGASGSADAEEERLRRPALPADFVQLFVAVIRSMGVTCRLALMADPFDVPGFMQGKVAQARAQAASITDRAHISRNNETKQIEVSLSAGQGADDGQGGASTMGEQKNDGDDDPPKGAKKRRVDKAGARSGNSSKTIARVKSPQAPLKPKGSLALGSRRTQAQAIIWADFEAAAQRSTDGLHLVPPTLPVGKKQPQPSDSQDTHQGSESSSFLATGATLEYQVRDSTSATSSGTAAGRGGEANSQARAIAPHPGTPTGRGKKRKRMRPGAQPSWRRFLPNPSKPRFIEDLAAAGVVRWWAEVLVRGGEPVGAREQDKVAPESEPAAAQNRRESHVRPPRWVPVDPIRGLVDTPLVPVALRAKTDPISYVLAASGSGRLSDVTRRYAVSWPDSKAIREKSGVGPAEMAGLLRSFEPTDAHPTPRSARRRQAQGTHEAAHMSAIDEAEAHELREAELAVPIPTSVGGFRSSKSYALQGSLLKTQTVQPGAKPVSIFKGKSVYLRRDVCDCLSKDKWLQLHARSVRTDELGKPMMVIRYKPRYPKQDREDDGSLAPGAGVHADEEIDEAGRAPRPDADGCIPLPHYGKWQTVPFQPERLENGIVPRNRFGNVELWNEKCMPIGCVLVDHPMAAKVAASLRVDYAKAFRGFLRKRGKATPDLRGIVVAAQHADMVQLGSIELQEDKDRKAAEKRSKQAIKRWGKLVHKALLRVRLRKDYGPGGAAASGASAVAGQKSAKKGSTTTNAPLKDEKGTMLAGVSGSEGAQASDENAEISARLVDNSAKLSAISGMLRDANSASVVSRAALSAEKGGRRAIESDDEAETAGGRPQDDDAAKSGHEDEDEDEDFEDFDASVSMAADEVSDGDIASNTLGAHPVPKVGPSSRKFETL